MTISEIWTKDGGSPIVDSNGNPYECEDCPCDDDANCPPCYQSGPPSEWTGKHNLTLNYSGFQNGMHCPGEPYDHHDNCYAYPGCSESSPWTGGGACELCWAVSGGEVGGGLNAMTVCSDMNRDWNLTLQDVDSPYWGCYWSVVHNIGSFRIGSSPLPWFNFSTLAFHGGPLWKLELTLYIYSGSYVWESTTLFTDIENDCSTALQSGVTFNSSILHDSGGSSPDLGSGCPCYVGSSPNGSAITATISGW